MISCVARAKSEALRQAASHLDIVVEFLSLFDVFHEVRV